MSAPTALAGVVDDMPDAEYHAHGALSSSGAKLLLPPSCPAKFHFARQQPRAPRKAFEIGTAAHKVVLGVGPELVIVEGDGKSGPEVWNTDKVRAKVADVRASGGVPLKPSEHATVHAMAAALREHPFAGRLFEPGAGQPEVSLFWRDEPSAVDCRARLDWVPDRRDGRLIVADYKSADSADPGKLQRSMFDFGYEMQAWWNLDGLAAAGLDDGSAAFVFVVQEKVPPYLVTVVELNEAALAIGERRAIRAREVFAECSATGHWPGYASDVTRISPPAWLARQYDLENF